MKKLKDIIPWTRGKEITERHPEDTFQSLQRQWMIFLMNHLAWTGSH